MKFESSDYLTVGIELELQLLDKDSLNLSDGIMPLLELYPDCPYVKPEFIQNTVEITSCISHSVSEAHNHMLGNLKGVAANCRSLNMVLCAAGTHPFSRDLATLTPFPRYLAMGERSGYLARNQITFATHVHVGIRTEEEALYLLRTLRNYLPLLIAVSANSPFWRGYNTDCASYRHRILAASRNYGIPPSFDTWQKFTDFLMASVNAGIIESVMDVHWDVRPRPHLGTIEIRTMDAQSSLTEAMEIAALVRSLVCYLLERKETEQQAVLNPDLPWWIIKNNHYAASQFGLDAQYVDHESGAFKPLLEVWKEVENELTPIAERLGEGIYFQRLVNRVKQKNIGYRRQLASYEGLGSFKKLVASLGEELASDMEQTIDPEFSVSGVL